MRAQGNSRTGGQILIDQLVAQGVERLTCVPGESYLAALDALHDAPIDVLVCRAEGGAAMMAEAYGKLTGRPGICFVTRGPGADQRGPRPAYRGAGFDADDPVRRAGGARHAGARGVSGDRFPAVFGSIAKWVVEVDDPARLPEFVARAFRVAMQGRPGPVVVALPEDVLTQTAAVADAPRVEPAEIWPSPDALARFAEMLAAAERPIAILGGSGWTAEASAAFARFAERHDLPVGPRSGGRPVSADHPNFVGDVGIGPNPVLSARIKSADLVLLLGGRLSEMPSSSYTLLDVPMPEAEAGACASGRRGTRPRLSAGAGDPGNSVRLCAALAALRHRAPATPRRRRTGRTRITSPGRRTAQAARRLPIWRGDGLAARPPAAGLPSSATAPAIIAGWLHRYYRFRQFGTQLAPNSGSMGYGVPAAILAKRQHPDRIVVAFAGDGCFLMNGQEFATAVQYDIPVIVVVIDNGMYGTIRMHQETNYPGRVSATP